MSSVSHHYIMSGMIYGFPFVQVSLYKSFLKNGKPAIDIFEIIYYNVNNEMENFRKKADKYF